MSHFDENSHEHFERSLIYKSNTDSEETEIKFEENQVQFIPVKLHNGGKHDKHSRSFSNCRSEHCYSRAELKAIKKFNSLFKKIVVLPSIKTFSGIESLTKNLKYTTTPVPEEYFPRSLSSSTTKSCNELGHNSEEIKMTEENEICTRLKIGHFLQGLTKLVQHQISENSVHMTVISEQYLTKYEMKGKLEHWLQFREPHIDNKVADYNICRIAYPISLSQNKKHVDTSKNEEIYKTQKLSLPQYSNSEKTDSIRSSQSVEMEMGSNDRNERNEKRHESCSISTVIDKEEAITRLNEDSQENLAHASQNEKVFELSTKSDMNKMDCTFHQPVAANSPVMFHCRGENQTNVKLAIDTVIKFLKEITDARKNYGCDLIECIHNTCENILNDCRKYGVEQVLDECTQKDGRPENFVDYEHKTKREERIQELVRRIRDHIKCLCPRNLQQSGSGISNKILEDGTNFEHRLDISQGPIYETIKNSLVSNTTQKEESESTKTENEIKAKEREKKIEELISQLMKKRKCICREELVDKPHGGVTKSTNTDPEELTVSSSESSDISLEHITRRNSDTSGSRKSSRRVSFFDTVSQGIPTNNEKDLQKLLEKASILSIKTQNSDESFKEQDEFILDGISQKITTHKVNTVAEESVNKNDVSITTDQENNLDGSTEYLKNEDPGNPSNATENSHLSSEEEFYDTSEDVIGKSEDPSGFSIDVFPLKNDSNYSRKAGGRKPANLRREDNKISIQECSEHSFDLSQATNAYLDKTEKSGNEKHSIRSETPSKNDSKMSSDRMKESVSCIHKEIEFSIKLRTSNILKSTEHSISATIEKISDEHTEKQELTEISDEQNVSDEDVKFLKASKNLYDMHEKFNKEYERTSKISKFSDDATIPQKQKEKIGSEMNEGVVLLKEIDEPAFDEHGKQDSNNIQEIEEKYIPLKNFESKKAENNKYHGGGTNGKQKIKSQKSRAKSEPNLRDPSRLTMEKTDRKTDEQNVESKLFTLGKKLSRGEIIEVKNGQKKVEKMKEAEKPEKNSGGSKKTYLKSQIKEKRFGESDKSKEYGKNNVNIKNESRYKSTSKNKFNAKFVTTTESKENILNLGSVKKRTKRKDDKIDEHSLLFIRKQPKKLILNKLNQPGIFRDDLLNASFEFSEKISNCLLSEDNINGIVLDRTISQKRCYCSNDQINTEDSVLQMDIKVTETAKTECKCSVQPKSLSPIDKNIERQENYSNNYYTNVKNINKNSKAPDAKNNASAERRNIEKTLNEIKSRKNREIFQNQKYIPSAPKTNYQRENRKYNTVNKQQFEGSQLRREHLSNKNLFTPSENYEWKQRGKRNNLKIPIVSRYWLRTKQRFRWPEKKHTDLKDDKTEKIENDISKNRNDLSVLDEYNIDAKHSLKSQPTDQFFVRNKNIESIAEKIVDDVIRESYKRYTSIFRQIDTSANQNSRKQSGDNILKQAHTTVGGKTSDRDLEVRKLKRDTNIKSTAERIVDEVIKDSLKIYERRIRGTGEGIKEMLPKRHGKFISANTKQNDKIEEPAFKFENVLEEEKSECDRADTNINYRDVHKNEVINTNKQCRNIGQYSNKNNNFAADEISISKLAKYADIIEDICLDKAMEIEEYAAKPLPPKNKEPHNNLRELKTTRYKLYENDHTWSSSSLKTAVKSLESRRNICQCEYHDESSKSNNCTKLLTCQYKFNNKKIIFNRQNIKDKDLLTMTNSTKEENFITIGELEKPVIPKSCFWHGIEVKKVKGERSICSFPRHVSFQTNSTAHSKTNESLKKLGIFSTIRPNDSQNFETVKNKFKRKYVNQGQRISVPSTSSGYIRIARDYSQKTLSNVRGSALISKDSNSSSNFFSAYNLLRNGSDNLTSTSKNYQDEEFSTIHSSRPIQSFPRRILMDNGIPKCDKLKLISKLPSDDRNLNLCKGKTKLSSSATKINHCINSTFTGSRIVDDGQYSKYYDKTLEVKRRCKSEKCVRFKECEDVCDHRTNSDNLNRYCTPFKNEKVNDYYKYKTNVYICSGGNRKCESVNNDEKNEIPKQISSSCLHSKCSYADMKAALATSDLKNKEQKQISSSCLHNKCNHEDMKAALTTSDISNGILDSREKNSLSLMIFEKNSYSSVHNFNTDILELLIGNKNRISGKNIRKISHVRCYNESLLNLRNIPCDGEGKEYKKMISYISFKPFEIENNLLINSILSLDITRSFNFDKKSFDTFLNILSESEQKILISSDYEESNQACQQKQLEDEKLSITPKVNISSVDQKDKYIYQDTSHHFFEENGIGASKSQIENICLKERCNFIRKKAPNHVPIPKSNNELSNEKSGKRKTWLYHYEKQRAFNLRKSRKSELNSSIIKKELSHVDSLFSIGSEKRISYHQYSSLYSEESLKSTNAVSDISNKNEIKIKKTQNVRRTKKNSESSITKRFMAPVVSHISVENIIENESKILYHPYGQEKSLYPASVQYDVKLKHVYGSSKDERKRKFTCKEATKKMIKWIKSLGVTSKQEEILRRKTDDTLWNAEVNLMKQRKILKSKLRYPKTKTSKLYLHSKEYNQMQQEENTIPVANTIKPVLMEIPSTEIIEPEFEDEEEDYSEGDEEEALSTEKQRLLVFSEDSMVLFDRKKVYDRLQQYGKLFYTIYLNEKEDYDHVSIRSAESVEHRLECEDRPFFATYDLGPNDVRVHVTKDVFEERKRDAIFKNENYVECQNSKVKLSLMRGKRYFNDLDPTKAKIIEIDCTNQFSEIKICYKKDKECICEYPQVCKSIQLESSELSSLDIDKEDKSQDTQELDNQQIELDGFKEEELDEEQDNQEPVISEGPQQLTCENCKQCNETPDSCINYEKCFNEKICAAKKRVTIFKGNSEDIETVQFCSVSRGFGFSRNDFPNDYEEYESNRNEYTFPIKTSREDISKHVKKRYRKLRNKTNYRNKW